MGVLGGVVRLFVVGGTGGGVLAAAAVLTVFFRLFGAREGFLVGRMLVAFFRLLGDILEQS